MCGVCVVRASACASRLMSTRTPWKHLLASLSGNAPPQGGGLKRDGRARSLPTSPSPFSSLLSPQVKFPAGFFHPNVYPSGTVCLSILNEEEGWRPSITVRSILLGIQDLLDTPNEGSPAQSDAYVLFTQQLTEYRRRVRAQAGRYPPPS